MKTWKADLALAAVTIIWGSTFVVVKNALASVSPVLFLAMRFTLAAVVLIAIHAAIYRSRFDRRSVLAGIAAGFLLFAGYFFQTVGLRLTTPSKSAFFTGLSIPMVPLVAALVYRKVPYLLEIVGVLFASVGMALMALEGEALKPGRGVFDSMFSDNMFRGDLLSFLCAIAFAIHIVLIGHYTGMFGFETIAVTQISTAAVLSLGSFWWMEAAVLHWNSGVLAPVLITGLLATALALSVQAWAQQFTTATRAALIFALEPLVAWLTSWWFAGEVLSRRGEIGAFCILSGILLVEVKRFNPLKHQSSSAATSDSTAARGV